LTTNPTHKKTSGYQAGKHSVIHLFFMSICIRRTDQM